METLKLKDGRVIDLREMGALDRLRLFKAAGPDLSRNDAWLSMAFVACAAAAIDGVPLPFPVNEQQVEALVGRLGDASLDEISAKLDARAQPLDLSQLGN